MNQKLSMALAMKSYQRDCRLGRIKLYTSDNCLLHRYEAVTTSSASTSTSHGQADTAGSKSSDDSARASSAGTTGAGETEVDETTNVHGKHGRKHADHVTAAKGKDASQQSMKVSSWSSLGRQRSHRVYLLLRTLLTSRLVWTV